MSSEFACDVACANIPQDHRLIRAAGTNLAAVVGAVKTNQLSDSVGRRFKCVCVCVGGVSLFTLHKHL